MELKQLKDSDALAVIDVMTPEEYGACHIAGARNACVYEMAFLDRIEDLALDRAAPLVVYDATGIAIGLLTIKNTARPIRFPADVGPEKDASLKAYAALDIDRTLWNVNYGSGRLYERLGMHLVHDLISLELFIKAK